MAFVIDTPLFGAWDRFSFRHRERKSRRKKKEIPRRVAERFPDRCVPFLRRLCEKRGRGGKKRRRARRRARRRKGGGRKKEGIKDVKLKSGAFYVRNVKRVRWRGGEKARREIREWKNILKEVWRREVEERTVSSLLPPSSKEQTLKR